MSPYGQSLSVTFRTILSKQMLQVAWDFADLVCIRILNSQIFLIYKMEPNVETSTKDKPIIVNILDSPVPLP